MNRQYTFIFTGCFPKATPSTGGSLKKTTSKNVFMVAVFLT
jgi:hypothetical protein